LICPSSTTDAPSAKWRTLSGGECGATASRAGIDAAAAIASSATPVAAAALRRMKSKAAATAIDAAIHSGTAR
jgi:hypothetical protein